MHRQIELKTLKLHRFCLFYDFDLEKKNFM